MYLLTHKSILTKKYCLQNYKKKKHLAGSTNEDEDVHNIDAFLIFM